MAQRTASRSNKKPLGIREITIFAMLGAMMFASKKVMEVLPNIHLIGVFIVTLTVVYRVRALIPIYIYVFLEGLFAFFSGTLIWWYPYLYIWTVLWGITMLLPKKMPEFLQPVVYMTVCALHGFAFGLLYAPAQALILGFDFKQTIAWIVAGLPFDITHGVSNFICGIMIVPLIKIIRRADKMTR